MVCNGNDDELQSKLSSTSSTSTPANVTNINEKEMILSLNEERYLKMMSLGS